MMRLLTDTFWLSADSYCSPLFDDGVFDCREYTWSHGYYLLLHATTGRKIHLEHCLWKRKRLTMICLNGSAKFCCSDHKKSSCPKPRDLQKKYRLTYRRKFRSQTSDNMERWKSRGGQSQRREDQRRERVRRKKMQAREKGRKAAIHCVFPIICGSAGSKSRLAEPSGQMRDEQLHAVVQNALARGRQLCTQLSIFEGSLAELLRFWCCQLENWGSLAE